MSRREHGDPQIEELNVGEASEPEGRGTGECGRAERRLTAEVAAILISYHRVAVEFHIGSEFQYGLQKKITLVPHNYF